MRSISETEATAIGARGEAERSRVIVVSSNVATGIVAAAIVEKCGFKAERTDYDGALKMLAKETPVILIIDEGCYSLTRIFEKDGGPRPYIIGLGITDADELDGSRFDTFVRKPLTTDRLQPVIFRYLDENSDTGIA